MWLYLNQYEVEYMRECMCFLYEYMKVAWGSGWNVPGDCDSLRSTSTDVPRDITEKLFKTFCNIMMIFIGRRLNIPILKDRIYRYLPSLSYTPHPFFLYWFELYVVCLQHFSAFSSSSCFVCRHYLTSCVVSPSCFPLGMFPTSIAVPGWHQEQFGSAGGTDPCLPSPWLQPGSSDLSSS